MSNHIQDVAKALEGLLPDYYDVSIDGNVLTIIMDMARPEPATGPPYRFSAVFIVRDGRWGHWGEMHLIVDDAAQTVAERIADTALFNIREDTRDYSVIPQSAPAGTVGNQVVKKQADGSIVDDDVPF